MIALAVCKAKIRKAAFLMGICAFLLSLLLLVTSFANAKHITGYLAQADAAFPYVQRGIFAAFCAFVLCCFGRAASRIIAVSLSSLLLLYWFFLGATLY